MSSSRQRLNFVTLDVFTREPFKGNPLAVVRVPHGRDVATSQMQAIAREFNLSETIFVHERAAAEAEVQGKEDGCPEWRVRIFTVSREISFAGHPTIGAAVWAFSQLAGDGDASHGRFLTTAGAVDLRFADGVAEAKLPLNLHEHTKYPVALDDVYALQPSLRGVAIEPEAIGVASPLKGMTFFHVLLPSIEALSKVTLSATPSPKLDDYDGWDDSFVGSYFYVITNIEHEANVDRFDIRCRMIEGSFEDPATGSAASGICCLVALKYARNRSCSFHVTQGVELGRKSDVGLKVMLDSSLKSVESVHISGSAVKVMEGSIEY